MSLFDFFPELKKRNSLLFWFGGFNVLLLLLAAMMFFVDDTIISGINAWIKPMKFAMTVIIYCWTFAWLLEYLPSQGKKKVISVLIIICMAVENGFIFLQAFRGVRSHFNVQTAFDGIVFSIMGLFILINSFVILYTIVLFFSGNVKLETRMLWAWRAGLILFFLGGISGGIMSGLLTHTVGASDGGPGLPFLNWSTVAGDIRTAHFFTLHGLQIIPLAAFAAGEISKQYGGTISILFVSLYVGFCIWLHWIAFQGLPLFVVG